MRESIGSTVALADVDLTAQAGKVIAYYSFQNEVVAA